MKIVFKLLFTLYLSSVLLEANEALIEHNKLPLALSLPYLQSIKGDAIDIGKGPVEAHVFVDPKCPRSREFIALINESDKMQSRYTYHIYLYELKRFKSKPLIEAIYSQKERLKALLDVMLENKNLRATSQNPKIAVKIKTIEKVGKAIDVYKRPYLVLVKKGKM